MKSFNVSCFLKGVLSMRHIMPDLEAKVYINGSFFATYRVGEQEYLDWF